MLGRPDAKASKLVIHGALSGCKDHFYKYDKVVLKEDLVHENYRKIGSRLKVVFLEGISLNPFEKFAAQDHVVELNVFILSFNVIPLWYVR